MDLRVSLGCHARLGGGKFLFHVERANTEGANPAGQAVEAKGSSLPGYSNKNSAMPGQPSSATFRAQRLPSPPKASSRGEKPISTMYSAGGEMAALEAGRAVSTSPCSGKHQQPSHSQAGVSFSCLSGVTR